jgi:hypothetical protein
MSCVRLPGADELAHLIQPLWRQPSRASSALRRIAIGPGLVGYAERVPAFMLKYPQLHRSRYFWKQFWIDDDEALIGAAA